MADNKFNLYQQLTSTGAEYVHAFSHKGRQYLAVVNGYNLYTSTQDSQVYIRNSSMAAEDVGCSNVHGGHCWSWLQVYLRCESEPYKYFTKLAFKNSSL